MANALIVVAVGIVVLVLAASALAVGFATRSAVALNHEVVEVLHLVGADDNFVAREFQRRFFALGIEGGALGAAAAAICYFIAGILSTKFASSAAADQMEAVFGSFRFGALGYVLIAAVAVTVASFDLSRVPADGEEALAVDGLRLSPSISCYDAP